ncbi:fibroblast growth factor receptor substrate 2 [Salmo trutta]|uniref:fibroblast growth factor receptor substrate 2 n=1 Tax=Salmo trutta TaxID=8032 RepID=UPI0011320DC7|nr:fibroblast growth factor receptor substrate 2-like [Salmo trutta]XP_029604333.1 fibroblast growth factor receptor substrate 2-like [Salmo trutta]XP_029604334.1 fibroblast growth factor receptor substrate 2-like [Salmo trutta]XP_029604335.1 fibroblast growth factor receptor substrate 2-like [Salmo trutta]
MGSYCSCPDKDSIPDKHQSKFKVINVDDDGNELGSGLMELTEEELILHTRKRDTVKWPYLCLRRYGYDSNLFSFESGRRCQTGQGIFAFKCVRAEEMFNMLQDIMHNNSISVVEEQVVELNPIESTELTRKPHTAAAAGYSVPTLPNGLGRYPWFGEASSRPSSRHPSVGSARLPSVGEESSHPLLVSDQSVHTYVNTPGIQDDRRTRPSSHTPLELRLSNPETTSSLATAPPSPTETDMDTEPQVLLEPEGVKFILGPTPAQRRQKQTPGDEDGEAGSREMALGVSGSNGEPSLAAPSGGLNGSGNGCVVGATLGLQAGDCDTGYDSDERKDGPPPPLPPNPNPPPHPGPKPSTISTYEHHNGNTTHPYVSTPVPAPNPRRNRPAIPLPDSSHNANNSAQRRTALLNYENLPALPPVWETARRFSEGDEEDEEEVYHGYEPKTPSLNGYHHHHHHHLHHHGLGLDPMHNYVNTENVNVSLSAKLDSARILPRGRDSSGVCLTPTVFNFDFRSGRLAGGPCGLGLDPLRQLNYIELEMEKGSDSSGPQTPKTPTTPCGVGLGSLLLPPSTPTRRTELYAMIDIERTAAMSSLQKALPRDDGTSRKTRHNSTDLPM